MSLIHTDLPCRLRVCRSRVTRGCVPPAGCWCRRPPTCRKLSRSAAPFPNCCRICRVHPFPPSSSYQASGTIRRPKPTAGDDEEDEDDEPELPPEFRVKNFAATRGDFLASLRAFDVSARASEEASATGADDDDEKSEGGGGGGTKGMEQAPAVVAIVKVHL